MNKKIGKMRNFQTGELRTQIGRVEKGNQKKNREENVRKYVPKKMTLKAHKMPTDGENKYLYSDIYAGKLSSSLPNKYPGTVKSFSHKNCECL